MQANAQAQKEGSTTTLTYRNAWAHHMLHFPAPIDSEPPSNGNKKRENKGKEVDYDDNLSLCHILSNAKKPRLQ